MCDTNNSLPHPVHKVEGNFPGSQHHLTFIYHPALLDYTPTTLLPRWNFNKADWCRFEAETANMCDDLPSPDAGIDLCYTTFQNSL